MKPNILKRLSALAMTAVMAFSISGGVSAADADTATIDTSRSTSLTLYKYDLNGAENDGVWDSQSYVSTGLADEQVNTALSPVRHSGRGVFLCEAGGSQHLQGNGGGRSSGDCSSVCLYGEHKIREQGNHRLPFGIGTYHKRCLPHRP